MEIDGKPIKTVWRNKNKVLTKDRETVKTKGSSFSFILSIWNNNRARK